MNGAKAQTVSLYFAVLDGSDPRTWTPYGKDFPSFMRDSCDAAQPTKKDVLEDLLQDYNVQVEPIWSGPSELLEETTLDRVVGVIIDAFPKPKSADDHAGKLRVLRRHLRRFREENQGNAGALFKRFGYSIWFMTDNTAEIAEFKQMVLDAAAGIKVDLRRTSDSGATLEHQVFRGEDWLARHLTSYLQNVYVTLAQG